MGIPHRYKGEVFRNIVIFDDRVEFIARNETITLNKEDLPCLKNGRESCKESGCEFFINCEEFDNCVINVNRCMTLDEIGKMLGVSREMIRQDEERALKKSHKIMKKLYGHRSIDRPLVSQFLPDPPQLRDGSHGEMKTKFIKMGTFQFYGNK